MGKTVAERGGVDDYCTFMAKCEKLIAEKADYAACPNCGGLGLVLGYLRERSGSLAVPILAHILFNGVNFTLFAISSSSGVMGYY